MIEHRDSREMVARCEAAVGRATGGAVVRLSGHQWQLYSPVGVLDGPDLTHTAWWNIGEQPGVTFRAMLLVIEDGGKSART